jgi:hypothetical protein
MQQMMCDNTKRVLSEEFREVGEFPEKGWVDKEGIEEL